MSGPRRLDVHHARKLKPETLARYRQAGVGFSEWLQEQCYDPIDPAEWDDLLVEYKNDS